VLAGPAALLEGLEHDRRRFGGALAQFWPLAVMVLETLEAKLAAWPEALRRAREVRTALGVAPGLRVEPMPGEPTNSFWLEAPALAPAALRAAAAADGLALPVPEGGRFVVRANSSWLDVPPTELAARIAALPERARR